MIRMYYTDTTTGVMATGFKKIYGSWYYFKTGNSGMMLTGTQKIGGCLQFKRCLGEIIKNYTERIAKIMAILSFSNQQTNTTLALPSARP